MKLNLEYGQNILNGYLNISAWPPQELPKDLPEGTQIAVGQVGNLDSIVSDSSAEEIIFNPFLNLVKPNDILTILNHWKKKLKENGVLKFSFIDIRLLSRFIYSGEMRLQNIHELVFGPARNHESIIETDLIRGVLKNIGFKIDSISHENCFVTMEVSK